MRRVSFCPVLSIIPIYIGIIGTFGTGISENIKNKSGINGEKVPIFP